MGSQTKRYVTSAIGVGLLAAAKLTEADIPDECAELATGGLGALYEGIIAAIGIAALHFDPKRINTLVLK